VGTTTRTLTGASAYDGNTTVSGGRLVVKNSGAFGTTNGYTVVNRFGGTNIRFTDSTGQVQLDGSGGALAIGESFIINGDQQYGYAGALRSTAGNNVINGWIIVGPSGRIGVDAGTLTLNGPVFRANATYNPMLVLSPNSAMIVSNTIDIGAGLINFHSGGLTTLCSTSNTWGSAQIQYGGIVRLGTNDALAVGKQVWLGNNEPGNGKIDLYGYSQMLGGLQEYGNVTSKLYNVVTNGRPEKSSTLPLNMGSGVTNLFGGRLCGTMDLVKAGAANSLMTLWGTNSLSGKVTVTGGTLALSATGVLGADCTNVTVSAGTLSLQNSSALPSSVVVGLASGGSAKVSLSSGVNQSVAYLFIDGQMQRAGTYGSTSSAAANKNDALFSGAGVLTVRLDNTGTLFRVQ
jgi:autotransporter-associated beta strand protein